MTRISEHITFEEATKSQTAIRAGIKNVPGINEIDAMILVAEKIFEPVRKHFGVPIGISSFFRGKALNALVGGAKASQHMSGEAMDIDADTYGRITNKQIFDYILKNLEFDQLIWEFGDDKNPEWVHASFRVGGNRRNVLKAVKQGYKTVYIPFKK